MITIYLLVANFTDSKSQLNIKKNEINLYQITSKAISYHTKVFNNR